MADASGPTVSGAGFDNGDRFVRDPGVLWRDAAGVTLVRRVDDPEVVELFDTGVLLWLALLEPVTARELTNELAEVLGAPAAVVARDVDTALADLVRRRLVTRLEAGR